MDTWDIADVVVLDPVWFANAVATVVTDAKDKTTRLAAKVFNDELQALWDSLQPPIPQQARPLLLDLLYAYKVLYPARDKSGTPLGFSVVPAMLEGVPEPHDLEAVLRPEQADEQVRCTAIVNRLRRWLAHTYCTPLHPHRPHAFALSCLMLHTA